MPTLLPQKWGAYAVSVFGTVATAATLSQWEYIFNQTNGDAKEETKAEERSPADDKKLSDKEADKAAKKAGYKDAHDAKEQNGARPPSRYDLYKGTDGKTYIKPKGGIGPGEPID